MVRVLNLIRADKIPLKPTVKWYFNKPLPKFGGGEPFWDSYIHSTCRCTSTTTTNPFRKAEQA